MRKLAAACLLTVSAIVFIGLVGRGDTKSSTYISAPIERGTISTVVKATGVVNAVAMVDVGSQLSGQVSEVLVNFNDPVQAGQVIARIDPESYVAAVTEAKAVLKVVQAAAQQQSAALRRARVATENARTAHKVGESQLAAMQAQQDEVARDFERNAALSKTAAISNRDFTQSRALRNAGIANLQAAEDQLKMKLEAIEIADAELAMAEANLASSEAVVEQKRASLEQAQVNLGRTQIRAPIDGIVIKRAINPGQTVAVSLESKTLFKIANDLGEMEVDARIDEADVGLVKAGEAVTFTVDAYPEKVFSGRVLQVRKSPEVNQNVVTYMAVVSAHNPEQLLFPGMTARLRIVVEETEPTLKIATSALHFWPQSQPSEDPAVAAGKSATVWVVHTGADVAPVPVTIGASDETGTQLLSGSLAVGDRVVVGQSPAAERSRLFHLW
jgi:HlyD family secretion protein